MNRKTLIIIIVAVICAACALLDAYDVVPRFKRLLGIIELPCFIFLFYTYYRYRKQASAKQEAPSKFESSVLRIYYYAFRFAGFWFLILGSIMALYLTVAMLTHQPHFPVSDIWPGAVGSAFLAVVGFLIIRFRPFKSK
jgi:hypothetical protein